MNPVIVSAISAVLLLWVVLYLLGAWLAKRDRLQKVDVIVCLAGSRGDLSAMNDKIDTAKRLYENDWAPLIVMSGMFSKKTGDNFKQIDKNILESLIRQKRLSDWYSKFAFENWDLNLGADYMKRKLVESGISESDVLVENKAIHTYENATFTAEILRKHNLNSIILVAAPYHQRRAYKYFKEALSKDTIKIFNYAASSQKWPRFAWFLFPQNLKTVALEVRGWWWHRNWEGTFQD